MFCQNCGSRLNENSRFCENCGAPVGAPYPQNQQPQPQYPQQPYGQPQYQQPYGQPQYQYVDPRFKGFPMNWHKFLVYFAIWFGALSNLFGGIMAITGAQYGKSEVANAVYRYFSALKTVDIVMGVLEIAMAALLIYTGVRLIGLKRGAPKLVAAVFISGAAVSALYFGAVLIIIVSTRNGISLSEVFPASTTVREVVARIAAIVFCIVNAVYYKRRESVFVY